MRRIIPLYILKEILPSFFINLLVFTFILLMAKVLQLTELIVVRGIHAGTVFNLVALNLPFFLSMTIPMSTLLAVLTAFLRLTGDSEITVLKSAGIGLYQLMPPVILFCLWTYMLTTYLTLFLVPAANWQFRMQVLELAKTRADVSIKEQVFNADFKDMVIFVNHMSLNSDMMENIFIQDERDPEVVSVIVAHQGRVATDPEQGVLVFQLFNGLIDRLYRNYQSTETIQFDQYQLKMDLQGELGNPELLKKNQAELPTDDLWQEVDRLKTERSKYYTTYLMDAHKRFALPFSCIVLGLFGVPLGVQFRVRGRNWGIIMGLIVFLVYYILLSIGWSFGESGEYPPALGMWVPNIIIGAAAVYMLNRTNKESPLGVISLINQFLMKFKSNDKENHS